MKVIETFMVRPLDAYWEYMFYCEGGIFILEGKEVTRDYAVSLLHKHKIQFSL